MKAADWSRRHRHRSGGWNAHWQICSRLTLHWSQCVLNSSVNRKAPWPTVTAVAFSVDADVPKIHIKIKTKGLRLPLINFPPKNTGSSPKKHQDWHRYSQKGVPQRDLGYKQKKAGQIHSWSRATVESPGWGRVWTHSSICEGHIRFKINANIQGPTC